MTVSEVLTPLEASIRAGNLAFQVGRLVTPRQLEDAAIGLSPLTSSMELGAELVHIGYEHSPAMGAMALDAARLFSTFTNSDFLRGGKVSLFRGPLSQWEPGKACFAMERKLCEFAGERLPAHIVRDDVYDLGEATGTRIAAGTRNGHLFYFIRSVRPGIGRNKVGELSVVPAASPALMGEVNRYSCAERSTASEYLDLLDATPAQREEVLRVADRKLCPSFDELEKLLYKVREHERRLKTQQPVSSIRYYSKPKARQLPGLQPQAV